jgi:heat shock protein HslJ
MPMLPSEELTAEFASDRISGSGGCNRFMGSYQTEGETLTIGPLASTFKACEESISTQETRYLQALQGAQRYEVTEQGLTIDYQTEEGAGVLRFVQADSEPEGTTGAQGGTQGGTQEGTQGGTQESTQEGVRGLW